MYTPTLSVHSASVSQCTPRSERLRCVNFVDNRQTLCTDLRLFFAFFSFPYFMTQCFLSSNAIYFPPTFSKYQTSAAKLPGITPDDLWNVVRNLISKVTGWRNGSLIFFLFLILNFFFGGGREQNTLYKANFFAAQLGFTTCFENFLSVHCHKFPFSVTHSLVTVKVNLIILKIN